MIIEISSTINNWKFILFKIIERIFLVSYQLQSQGSVEGYNKTIQHFRISVKDSTKDEFGFEEWMHEFLSFYNDKKHSDKNILQY